MMALDTVAPLAGAVMASDGGVASGALLNSAFALKSAFMASTQEPVPEQAPDQPANTEPWAGVADSVTDAPAAKAALQAAAQLMPAGALATAPEPVPDLAAVKR